ncbi:hypothetical protein CLV57_3636 [Mucilaginibacter auburnensis]|uniref:Uncharacterized protein n=1 Tax=Mucilaginibacter auburnensis TaxID=1457233 RepID=A0A2H9VQA5_9SPHI|nr:hypothetical protein CLV57_3636 [Mucilaginibacter auburnensis]
MSILTITNTNRKWNQVILWWEIRRITYNFIVLGVGLLSFFISYVSIPLVYISIAFWLNAIYTLGWIIELSIQKYSSQRFKLNYPPYAYLSYLAFSSVIVVSLALYFYNIYN